MMRVKILAVYDVCTTVSACNYPWMAESFFRAKLKVYLNCVEIAEMNYDIKIVTTLFFEFFSFSRDIFHFSSFLVVFASQFVWEFIRISARNKQG